MEAKSAVVAESTEFKKEETIVVIAENIEYEKEEGKKEKEVDSGDAKIGASSTGSVSESSSQNKKKNKKKKSNRIQVSNTKKPFYFYLNLAKSYIKQYNHIELTALGMAIPTVITIAEILRGEGLASNKEIKISTVESKEEKNLKGQFTKKSKIQIVLGKAETLDAVAAECSEKKAEKLNITTAVADATKCFEELNITTEA